MSEIAEEAIEGNGSLASLLSEEQPRFVVMPAISRRKNSSEEIFYTSDIEQLAKMEKLQNEYLEKLGKGISCFQNTNILLCLLHGSALSCT